MDEQAQSFTATSLEEAVRHVRHLDEMGLEYLMAATYILTGEPAWYFQMKQIQVEPTQKSH